MGKWVIRECIKCKNCEYEIKDGNTCVWKTERNPNAEGVSANPLLSDVADLKPCPFCGGDAGYSPSEDGNGKKFIYVECCSCSGMSNMFIKKDDAKKAWNSRV